MVKYTITVSEDAYQLLCKIFYRAAWGADSIYLGGEKKETLEEIIKELGV